MWSADPRVRIRSDTATLKAGQTPAPAWTHSERLQGIRWGGPIAGQCTTKHTVLSPRGRLIHSNISLSYISIIYQHHLYYITPVSIYLYLYLYIISINIILYNKLLSTLVFISIYIHTIIYINYLSLY